MSDIKYVKTHQTEHIEQGITNETLPSGFDSILCIDTVGNGVPEYFYVIGLCSNVTLSSQKPISQIPELGSNFTFLISDAAQNTLSLSRLMPIKKTSNNNRIGCLSFEIYNNYWNTQSYDLDLIMPDLDNPIYDHPFELYLLLLQETNGSRTIKRKLQLTDCMFAQYNIGEIVAGRKSVPETAVFVFGDCIDTAMLTQLS